MHSRTRIVIYEMILPTDLKRFTFFYDNLGFVTSYRSTWSMWLKLVFLQLVWKLFSNVTRRMSSHTYISWKRLGEWTLVAYGSCAFIIQFVCFFFFLSNWLFWLPYCYIGCMALTSSLFCYLANPVSDEWHLLAIVNVEILTKVAKLFVCKHLPFFFFPSFYLLEVKEMSKYTKWKLWKGLKIAFCECWKT